MESFIKTLQERGISHEIENGKFNVGGYLDLRGTGITALPEGLSVGDEIYQ